MNTPHHKALYTRALWFLLITLTACVCALVVSLSVGATFDSPQLVVEALVNYQADNINHIIIQTSRLPRTLYALVVGAALAVAGCLMQALARNPLASPSIFGINSGAMFAIVGATFFLNLEGIEQYVWFALIGAGLTSVLVYILGLNRHGRLDSLRIVLAGAAVSALMSAFTHALLVVDQEGLDSILFWLAGSVANRDLSTLQSLSPYLFAALAVAWMMSKPINILMSGDDIAKSLGQKTLLVQLLMGLLVIVLAACAVSLAGNIGFIGLVVPHMVRRLLKTATHHQWIIPSCAALGALLLLVSDIIARVLIFPEEIPIGVMSAFIGVPVFVYLLRTGRGFN